MRSRCTRTYDYPVSKAWHDARVRSVQGGADEILEEIVDRSTDPDGCLPERPH